MARILHMDGDPSIRQLVKRILEEEGHQVISAADIEEARFTEGEFDLFISDSDINKPFDGLLFILDRIEEGELVLILAEGHKFTRISFCNRGLLRSNPEKLVAECERILGGGA